MTILYVIYDHPRDCPNHWVVRRSFAGAKNGVAFTYFAAVGIACQTLEEARATLPSGLYNLGRSEADDPVIAEVWI